MAQDCRWRKAGNLRDEGEPKISAARLLPGRDSLNELVGMTGFELATFTPSPISPSFQRIARLVIGLREKSWAVDRTIEVATINGETGLCIRDGERLTATLSIASDGDRILAVYAVLNPDKLH